MSKLTTWARKNPEAAAFLKSMFFTLLNNHGAQERQAALDSLAELDTDGDGIPDALETETAPAKPSRKRR